jgi:hypothetical protein
MAGKVVSNLTKKASDKVSELLSKDLILKKT